MRKFISRAVTSIAALGVALAMSPANAVQVSTQLGLVVDISGSVDDTEYNLQRQGYVDAFNNPAIQSLISNSPNGVAVAVFYFSTLATATRTDSSDPDYVSWSAPILDWTLLQDAADASAFATAIGNIARPTADPSDPKGDTNIADGVQAAANSMLNNGFEGRMVIDVSGDGAQNTELDGTQPDDGCNGDIFTQISQVCFDVVEGQRDAAGAAGITINGLAITTESPLLEGYFADHVITGDGSFVLVAESFEAFGSAIAEKIATEIIPVPAAVYLFGSALLGLGGLARRRQKN
ncbi:MAG: DUF1194 domain-containing protein [Chromatiales bacterium]|nr:MAG: DUF1194 domain-containing protein [Chromatiales bacterium]